MKLRILALWTASIAAAGALRAQEAPVARYTLEDCIRIGMERSVRAANARRDQAIAGTIVGQARAEALPQLSLRGDYKRLDEVTTIDFGGATIPLGSLNNYSAAGEVSQLLFSGGRVRAALKAAGLSRELADWTKSDTEAALVRDIRTGFLGILLAQAAVQVAEESVVQTKALVAQTEEKQRMGRAAEFDAVSARVRLSNEVPILLRARNRLAVASEAFRWLVNLDGGPYELVGELACEAWDPDLAALQKQALANRSALRMMETVVRLREQDVAAAGSGVRPSVKAHGAYEGADPYSFGTAQGGWEWHWNAGLSLTWTLWDGALTRNVVAEKKLELEKSRADLEDLRRAVALEVQQAYLELAAAQETVQAGADSVAMAEQALEIAKARYEAGLATRLEFTDATLQLSTARLLRCTALHDHMAAAARLRYAAGLDGIEMKPENRP